MMLVMLVMLVWPWLVSDNAEALLLARPSLGNTKTLCTMYRVHSTEYRRTQAGERRRTRTRTEGERERAKLCHKWKRDVVSGREWGIMASGEVGLDAAGSASEPPPVGHRSVTCWALGTR